MRVEAGAGEIPSRQRKSGAKNAESLKTYDEVYYWQRGEDETLANS